MICQHCGQPIPRAPVEIVALARTLRLPRREMLALDAIIAAWPRPASKDYLVASMYDAVGEDAEQPEVIVQSHISKLRTILRPHGWTIENQRFVGYRLVKRNTGTMASSFPPSAWEAN